MTLPPAPICYVEIPAPNISAAGSFYGSVFGWQIQPSKLSDKEYWEFRSDEGQLTGPPPDADQSSQRRTTDRY